MNTNKHGCIEALTVFTLLLAVGARANPSFVLTPATQIGVGSNEVYFAAALTNTGSTTNLYLNDLRLDFTNTATNYLAAHTNVFFANVPGILLTGETYTGVVFGVAINPATPPGNYSGTATVLGGTNIFGTNTLVSQNFQILLLPAILKLTAVGTNCVLAWPTPPGGCVLQENDNLTTTKWTTVTNAPTVSNGWNRVILPSPSGNCFYRLTYP